MKLKKTQKKKIHTTICFIYVIQWKIECRSEYFEWSIESLLDSFLIYHKIFFIPNTPREKIDFASIWNDILSSEFASIEDNGSHPHQRCNRIDDCRQLDGHRVFDFVDHRWIQCPHNLWWATFKSGIFTNVLWHRRRFRSHRHFARSEANWFEYIVSQQLLFKHSTSSMQ